MTGKLNGKVAVITGASKGIGSGIARVFAQQGAKLVVAARGGSVLDFAQELRDAGYESIGVQCDVTKPEDCKALAQTALDTYGRIDILDCNAGICHWATFSTRATRGVMPISPSTSTASGMPARL